MKFGELKAHWSWMLEHMADDEPVIFPRREAKKRLANKESRKRYRFSFACIEQDYKELVAIREAYMLACHDNPTLCNHGMIEGLRTFDLLQWLENQKEATQP